jgi:diacylglycerol kinase family enzyme
VVNPASGRGRSQTRAEALREALSRTASVEVVRTERRGYAVDVVSERGADFERVIAIGGDGTLNEVLTGLMRIDAPTEVRPALGFLPSGTANAAILAFGFGTAPDAVARSLAVVEARPVDVGIATYEGVERPFLLWCGAGYDAVVIDALNSERTGLMGIAGLVRKAPSVLRAVHRYPAPEIGIHVDGVSARGASVILANVGKVAFGGSVAEAADPFDGRLNVVTVPRVGTLGVAAFGVRMMLSSLEHARGAAHSQGARIRLDASEPVPFQLDGEPVGLLPVEVRIAPGAVRLLLT